MGAEQQQDPLDDIMLCYQAMGLPPNASAAEVEGKYQSLCEVYRKQEASGDPALCEQARLGLDMLAEVHGRITRSSAYHPPAATEQEQNPAEQVNGRPVHHIVAQRELMMACPRCNGSVVIGSRECPVCKTPILTRAEKIAAHFTTTRVILYLILAMVLALGALRVVNPELFPDYRPDVDFEK